MTFNVSDNQYGRLHLATTGILVYYSVYPAVVNV